MGGFSLWHWLITLLIVGIPALVVWLVVRASCRGAKRSAAAELLKLAQLKEKGLVTNEEFEHKRADLAQKL